MGIPVVRWLFRLAPSVSRRAVRAKKMTPRPTGIPTPTHQKSARDSVVWHDVECGGYAADLRLWEKLADNTPGPTLDLGCGTGRVALQLARRGHSIVGLDARSDLIDVLTDRAEKLPVDAVLGDARDFELRAEFGLVLAPMQLVQLFADADERIRCLSCVTRHLSPGGLAAFAIVEEVPASIDTSPPLPDTREVDGWVYSSLPVEAIVDAGAIRVRRLRQMVSPAGKLSEELDEALLQALDASTLEREAELAGLTPAGRRAVPPTDEHVGSTVVLLEREA
jgi:SAM-dependent methyltransferase